MDPMWLDRKLVARKVKGVDFGELRYDQEFGVYCYQGRPFTGVSTQRSPDGQLESIVSYVNGLAHGIAVGWYPNGQIELYNEVACGVRNGLYIEWAEDGTKLVEERYKNGRLIRTPRKKGRRKR